MAVAVLAGGTVTTARLWQPACALRTFSTGAYPYDLALSSTGRAYVINRTSDWTGMSADGGSVSLADLRSRTVVRSPRVRADPRAIALDEPDVRVFVTNDDDASVSVLDAGSMATVRTTQVGDGPRAVVVDAPAHRTDVVSEGGGALGMLGGVRATPVGRRHARDRHRTSTPCPPLAGRAGRRDAPPLARPVL